MKPIKSATVGVLVTAALFATGAWLASGFTAPGSETATQDSAYTSDQVVEYRDVSDTATVKPAAQALAQPDAAPVPGPAPAPEPVSQHVSLDVQIHGARSNAGSVVVMVFDNAQAFNNYDYNQAVGYKEVPASTRPLVATFPHLRSGPYAVTVFHDENEDLEFNISGQYPLEGYGTSNAKNYTQTLSFEQALVDAGAVSIELFYIDDRMM